MVITKEKVKPDKVTRVSWGVSHEGSNWKEAILAFLKGIWSADQSVVSKQRITFNNTTILFSGSHEYSVYFEGSQDRPMLCDEYLLGCRNVHEVSSRWDQGIEGGFARFVHNERIHHLMIHFPNTGTVVLSKGDGNLFIATEFLDPENVRKIC